MKKPQYPLEQLVEIKKKRVEDAQLVFVEKKEILEKEEKKLLECIAKKDKVSKHYDDKLEQFYDSLTGGTTSVKIKQKKLYLKIVLEDLKTEEKNVEKQRQVRNDAEEEKDKAKRVLDRRRVEVEKLTTHEKEWMKEVLKERKRLEVIEHDELGAAVYSYRKIVKKKKGE